MGATVGFPGSTPAAGATGSSKTPFKRTRTGCLTCREDGYKCDEKKPFCSRCIRLKKACKGYGLKLRWQTPTKSHQPDKDAKGQRKRNTSSRALTKVTPQSSGVTILPRTMSSQIPPQQGYLLNHWSTTLASLITMAPTARNQFHAHITPMITHSPSLRSAICFMSAYHLSVLKGDTSLLNAATWYQTNAVSLLARSGADHLRGAKAIIDRAGPKTWNCDVGTFLLSLCCYYDSIGSVSNQTPPILALGGDVPNLEGMEPMAGLKILWATVGRISAMRGQDKAFLDIQGSTIELALHALETYASQEGDAGHTTHAYKEAAHIYLHRVWHQVGSPHPATLKHARDCLNHLFKVPVSSPLVSAHVWPLWTAACETIDGQLRDSVRKRVKAMYEIRHLPSLRRLERDIEDVWEVKDKERSATGIDKVDCVQAILAMRQRGADLV